MRRQVIAVVVLGMVVNIYIPVAPSLLGAMVDYQGMTPEVAGQLISWNFWGATASTILAFFILPIRGWNIRLTMLVCLLLVAVSSPAAIWAADDVALLALVRFINGVGAGLGFTVAAVAVVGTPNVERSYAFLYGSPYLIGGLGLAMLPMLYGAVGIEGALLGMGLLNLLGCALVPLVPRYLGETPGADRQEQAAHLRLKPLLLGGLLLAAFFLHYVCNSGIWTYFERIGVSFGMTAQDSGAILGPSMSAGVAGMFLASVIGQRCKAMSMMLAGTLMILLSTLYLIKSPTGLAFGLATALFNACIPFVTPYFVAELSRVVPRGLGVLAANIATISGFSTGPYLVSLLLDDNDFTAAITYTAAGFVAVLLMLLWFSRLSPAGSEVKRAVAPVSG